MSARLVQNTTTSPDQNPTTPQKTYVLALYDLQTYDPNDLEFKAGDLLIVYDTTGEWWKGFNPRTGKKGFIPFNYVNYRKNTSLILDAIHEINREQAVKKLLANASNWDANFLLRPRAGDDSFALSVRYNSPEGVRVKHYMLSFDTSMGKCYLRDDSRFLTVQELITYYQQHEIEDNCHLRKPKVIAAAIAEGPMEKSANTPEFTYSGDMEEPSQSDSQSTGQPLDTHSTYTGPMAWSGVAASSQLHLPQHGVDAEDSGLLQDFRVQDPVFPSLLQYSAEAAEMKVIQLPGLVRVEGPGLRSVKEYRQDGGLVHLQFGVHVNTVAIQNGGMQPAECLTSFGDPLGNLVIDSRVA
ncbi:unnamed protein product [Schistocephalus solidus]|uniref:SH2 domain-containing protein n=1 Tax=Schistocephalus solidus TaxID=70667 RepID=A0A183TF24_SCHSO|nr:unnamed protein product [Schistocephalus solidus]